MKNLGVKLLQAQSKLKCNKSNYNSFGKYKYRTCEDILESAKPILHKLGMYLTLTDDIINMGDRFYIKATATVYDFESDEQISTTAFARESDSKAGMADSQLTGSCSSYARKYALNGLLCLDDSKDADSEESHNKSKQTSAESNLKSIKCSVCGTEIKNPKSVAFYQNHPNAQVLCFACNEKNKNK